MSAFPLPCQDKVIAERGAHLWVGCFPNPLSMGFFPSPSAGVFSPAQYHVL